MRKIKKIFENAVWWSGVVMVGLLLGVSLQFVRAWTEPTLPPPQGNVGAPINTGGQYQYKTGILGLIGGLITTRINTPTDTPAAGEVLTSLDNTGRIAWAQSAGGSCYVSYTNANGTNNCASGFKIMGAAIDHWGVCYNSYSQAHFAPHATCAAGWSFAQVGDAILCCR